MDFFKKIEKELESDIQKILQHPFLERITTASLNLKQLQIFAEQYAIYCYHFPRFLAATAANVPDDEARFPIIKNLWEEHGEGNIKKSQRLMYLIRLQNMKRRTMHCRKCIKTVIEYCYQNWVSPIQKK